MKRVVRELKEEPFNIKLKNREGFVQCQEFVQCPFAEASRNYRTGRKVKI